MERPGKQCRTKTEWYHRAKNGYNLPDHWNLIGRQKGRLISPDSSIGSLDDLSELSFYDLPTSMFQENTRLGRSLHLSELVTSPQRVTRPPHHAIAEARHIYTVDDSDHFCSLSTSSTQTMQNHTTQLQPSTQMNCHQTDPETSRPLASHHQHGDKKVAFCHVKLPNGTETSLDGSESVIVTTVGKPSVGVLSRTKYGNKSSNTQRPHGQQNGSNSRKYIAETQERSVTSNFLEPKTKFLQGRSTPSGKYHDGSYTGPLQQREIEPPNQPSFTLSSNGSLRLKSQHNGTAGQSHVQKYRHKTSGREQIKSVSFQDLGLQTVPDQEEKGNDYSFQVTDDSPNSQKLNISRYKQSNLSHSGKRLEELLQDSRSISSVQHRMRQLNDSSFEPLASRSFNITKISSPKPLSPPTRDTDSILIPKSSISDHGGAVQVLSLYDGKAVFKEHSPPAGRSKNRVWQSNTQVELQHILLKPDDEIGHKSSKRGTWLPLTRREDTSNKFSESTVGKSAARKRKGKEHSLDNSFEPDTWGHLSLANSFSVDTSQRISSALWAMKLMEAAHSSSPGTYQNLLLKARLFRRWLQKTRLKRIMKQEEKDKVESATAHWQTELLQKYFDAWRKCRQAMAVSAEMLNKKHLLRKGLTGLKFAVQRQKLVCSDVQSKVKGRLLARYWLKWQKALKKKEMQRLKSAFGLWKSNQLKQNREKILEDMADRHVMSRNYTRWKMRYEVEQKNSVASLHYKICLLTKSWHCWRVYAAELVVKKRLKDVARVHHDEHLTASLFALWKQNTRKSLLAGNVAGRRLIVKAFYRWKNWSQYAKVIRLRFQSMCKEYHYKSLVKAAFIKWQIRLQNKRADRFRRQTQQKRIFKLWYLRYRRKVIHRHLCKALAKKSKKRKFFSKWKHFTKVQQDKRERFVESVNLMALKRLFVKWKEHASMKSSLRTMMLTHSRRKDSQLTRKAMDKWLFAMKVVNFRKRVHLNWSRQCTRKACKSWKLLLRKKHLEQRLIDVTPTLKMLVMRRAFKKWLAQKRSADEEKEKIAHVKIILERNAKLRVLQAWRVANQESQIIAPTVARRERKVVARVFDAWRLHVYRQNYIVDHLTRTKETLLDKFFCHWRSRTVLIQKERNAIETLYRSKVSRHFKAWRGFVLDLRLERLRKRAKALSLMQRYFSIWKSKVEEKHEAKDEEDASQARQRLLISWVFNFWCESAKKLRDRLNKQEQQLISQNRRLLLAQVFRKWLKLYRNEEKARMHVKYRRDEFLRKIIQAWRKDTKETLEKEVFNFTTSLTFDSSMGSVFGSTFRSTLNSSYHSDALSTSGYGTDMRVRRGSGPVPIQYLKIDDRDDEVISLPGRFDQLRSPTVKTAPITVLREASSDRMSPQIVQQDSVVGHDSPRSVLTNSHHPIFPMHTQPTTPSSSPEQMLPSFTCTVPVKSEDDSVPVVGLHSGSDESEEQDDRGSIMSSFSMTGRSIESIRDREMVLTDTILHWRLLPLSLTFRTWMKFTRQRKLLRELLFYLREKKRKEVMARTLKKWRRELFAKVTAREHWLYKTRHRCLIAWHGYVHHSRIKEERKFMADKHRRTACLGRFLRIWKDRYIRKIRLQKFVIHWRKEALVSKQHKNMTETVKCKRNSRLLKEKFLYWMGQTKNSQTAKAFYFGKLVPKFFVAWHVFIREVVTRNQKLVMFTERRLLAMFFSEWRLRFIAARRAGDLIEVKETNLLLEIVKRWHSWAEGMSLRRGRAQQFRRSAELRTMKEIFAMWKDRSQQLRNSTKTYEHKLMRSVLCAWQSFTVLGIQNRQKFQEFREERARNLVRRSFNFWRCLQIHTERARNNLLQRERRLVKRCFNEWRHGTLKQRAHKHNGHRLQRKMFLSWYDQYTRRKTARRLIFNWRSKTEEAKIKNSKALEIVQEREKKLLRQSFDTWVLEAHKIQKAKNHASINCVQRAFLAWYTYSHTRVLQRRLLAEVEEKKRQTLLCNSFTAWSQLFQRRVHNLEVLEGFLELKQTQLLQACMLSWREDTLNCRAQKFHDRRLVQKCFVEWWFRLYTKRGLESVKEKIMTRKALQAAQHWRRWTVRVKKQSKQAGDLHSKLEGRLLHDYFARWVFASRQMQKAEYYHRQVIKKRLFRNWRDAVQRRLDEQRKTKEFQNRLNTKKMTKIFSCWRSALKTVTRQHKLVAKQMAVHNSRMLKHAMGRWQKFIMERRAEKHHNIVCIAKCFLEWKIKTEEKLEEKEKEQRLQEKADRFYRLKLSKKCFHGWLCDVRADQYERLRLSRLVERAFSTWKKKCSLNTIAKELVDRHLFDKYWNQWRRQLIRKRVSELMQKHEEKKLLSEVFVAWFRLVLVRRQLLRAYRTHVTKKWFIKWMQKYNES